MDFSNYILVYNKIGRLVEKKTFSYDDREDAINYMKSMSRKGYRVEETNNKDIYDKC